jgi:hypothetical protein
MVMKRNRIDQILFPGIFCVFLAVWPGLVGLKTIFNCSLKEEYTIEENNTDYRISVILFYSCQRDEACLAVQFQRLYQKYRILLEKIDRKRGGCRIADEKGPAVMQGKAIIRIWDCAVNRRMVRQEESHDLTAADGRVICSRETKYTGMNFELPVQAAQVKRLLYAKGMFAAL